MSNYDYENDQFDDEANEQSVTKEQEAEKVLATNQDPVNSDLVATSIKAKSSNQAEPKPSQAGGRYQNRDLSKVRKQFNQQQ